MQKINFNNRSSLKILSWILSWNYSVKLNLS